MFYSKCKHNGFILAETMPRLELHLKISNNSNELKRSPSSISWHIAEVCWEYLWEFQY